jgi:type I restriction enzyme S subunit
MKLETFFEKFDQFADAPDAVARMRELILLLALDGKIGDTTAATWERVQLGDLGEWGSGGTPLSTESRYYDGNIPWLIIGDLNDGVVTSSTKTITEEGLANSSARMLPKNVLLIAMYGSIGKLGITGIECATNQAIAFCKPDPDRADLRYLFHAFMGLRPKFLSRGQGLAQKNISQRILRAWEIGLPPLAEQKRIVAKVDELMALCDRLALQQQERETRHAALARASLARFADAPTPANLPFLFHSSFSIHPSDLRKSILTLAVQGKLVRFEAENDAQTVGDHIEFQNGYAFKSQWFKPDGMRLCRNVNVSHGAVDWSESAFVDDDVAKEFERFALSEGDIVLSLDRPLITTGLKVARIRKSDLPCLLLQRVAKPVPKHDQLDMSYFLLWLNSSEFVDSIDPGRSNGVPHISTRQVQLLPFVLPPLVEQRRIVAKVEQLMALVDALETQLAASRATAANLLSALTAT